MAQVRKRLPLLLLCGLTLTACSSSDAADGKVAPTTTGAASGSEASAARRDPVRIMPLGDSITEHNYYRPLLRKDLSAAGCNVDFVGSMLDTANTPDDPEHEGHGGFRADEIAAGTADWVAQAKPEIVLLHVGINDLWDGQDPASTIADISNVLDGIAASAPQSTVLLAQILPGDGIEAQVTEVNAGVRQLAAANNRDITIELVDQNSGVDARPTGDTFDGTHPTPAASQKMAVRWEAVLVPLLGDACD